MNVLLAEDDAQLRQMLCRLLTRDGHTVTQAGDGDAALRAFSQGTFDVVLTDIIMPNTEGIETIMELRRRQPQVPIIAMSGGARYHAYDPLKLALDCGADFVIAKPFEPAALRALILQCSAETAEKMSYP